MAIPLCRPDRQRRHRPAPRAVGRFLLATSARRTFRSERAPGRRRPRSRPAELHDHRLEVRDAEVHGPRALGPPKMLAVIHADEDRRTRLLPPRRVTVRAGRHVDPEVLGIPSREPLGLRARRRNLRCRSPVPSRHPYRQATGRGRPPRGHQRHVGVLMGVHAKRPSCRACESGVVARAATRSSVTASPCSAVPAVLDGPSPAVVDTDPLHWPQSGWTGATTARAHAPDAAVAAADASERVDWVCTETEAVAASWSVEPSNPVSVPLRQGSDRAGGSAAGARDERSSP